MRVSREAAAHAERVLREAIAEAIAVRLATLDIAAAELAAALGVTTRAVNHWCGGAELPSLSRLLTIAMAIRCKLRELIPDGAPDDADAEPIERV